MEQGSKIELKKSLRGIDLFTIGFGCIIGWGWISMGSYWIGAAGPVGAILAQALACVLMGTITIIYAELTGAMPRAGSVQNYAWRAFGPKMSLWAAWFMVMCSFVMSAWLANACIVAVGRVFPLASGPLLYTVYGYDVYLFQVILYVVLAFIMYIVAYRGINVMANVQNLAVALMFLVAIFFIGSAFVKGDPANLAPATTNGITGITGILLTTVTFFGGLEVLPQSAEESLIAPKKLGRIIMLVLLASFLWYALTILGTSLALPREALVSSNLAAIDAFMALYNGSIWARNLIAFVGLMGILTSWIAIIIVVSRLFYSMARVGMLPAPLSKLHPKYKSPVNALTVLFIFIVACAFLGGGVNIWFPTAAGFSSAIAYVIVTVCFLVLKIKYPEMDRPYNIKHWKLLAVVSISISVTLLVVSFPGFPGSGLKWPYEILTVLIWITIGVLLHIRLALKKDGFAKVDENMAEILSMKSKYKKERITA